MLERQVEKRRRGYAPRRGWDIARTWAVAYGSAWVSSGDLIDPPGGILCGYKKWWNITEALRRSGIPIERQPLDNSSYLYRLAPEVVQQLLYGSPDDGISAPSS